MAVRLAAALALLAAPTLGLDGGPWAAIRQSLKEQEQTFAPVSASASCEVSADESCPLADMTRDESTLVYPGGDTRCIFSDSGPFAFQVIPGSSSKVLLFFQGGGACWDKVSTAARACSTTAEPDSLTGLFDRTNEANPFKDYTVVNVLYCSGDLHAGNVTRPYDDSAGVPVQQAGYANTRSAVEWLKANTEQPLSDLVVSGCSAGSLGTQAWASLLLDELSYDHAAVVVDSYAGVFPEGTQGPLIYEYGMCDLQLLPDDLQASCEAQTLAVQDVFESAMVSNPNIGFANVNSKADSTQIAFYEGLALTLNVPPYTMSSSEYENELNLILERYNAQANYVSFLVTGTQHCFYPSSLTYSADTTGKAGQGASGATTLVSWTQGFPVLSGHNVSTECDGEQLASDEWSGSEYCDVEQQGKAFAAP